MNEIFSLTLVPVIAQAEGGTAFAPEAPGAATGDAAPLVGADGAAAGTAGGGGAGAGPNLMPFLFIMLGFMVFMMIVSSRAQKKERKKHQAMVDGISRNDRVMMNSGIIGTVVDKRNEEIVVRVDDSTNTRITFSISAVSQMLKEATRRDDDEVYEEPVEERETVNA